MTRAPFPWGALSVCALLIVGQAHAADPATPPSTVDTASARRDEAEQRRLRALAFYDSGDYAAARSEFAHANQLMPSFRLLYNLGVVSLDLADPAGAYDYFERYLAEGGELVPPETRTEVLGQLHTLAAHVVTVAIYVDTPGATVLVDENPVGVTPLARALHVNPGTRRLSVRMQSGRAQSKTLELSSGDSIRVAFTLALPPAPPAGPRQRIFWPGWAGTAALTAGAVFAGFEALSAQHDYQHQFDTITSRGELDHLDTRATRWSLAADTLASTAIIVGVYSLYMTLRRAPAQTDAANSTADFSLLSNQARAGIRF